MDVRPYSPSDCDACLAVFDSVTATLDRGEFETFLENPPASYFVMEHDGSIVGCGGFSIDAGQQLAELVWGMVRRNAQGQGLGRFLLLYRVREISKLGGVERVRLSTPESAAGFYAKQGFKPLQIAEGLVEMTMKLSVCP